MEICLEITNFKLVFKVAYKICGEFQFMFMFIQLLLCCRLHISLKTLRNYFENMNPKTVKVILFFRSSWNHFSYK